VAALPSRTANGALDDHGAFLDKAIVPGAFVTETPLRGHILERLKKVCRLANIRATTVHALSAQLWGSPPDGRRQPGGHARPQGPGDDADLRDGAAGAPPNRDWEAERLLPSANSDDASLKMRHSRGSPRDRRPEIVDGWEFREGLERKTAGPSVLPDDINRISAGIVVYFAAPRITCAFAAIPVCCATAASHRRGSSPSKVSSRARTSDGMLFQPQTPETALRK
jgi:hypothetical protein